MSPREIFAGVGNLAWGSGSSITKGWPQIEGKGWEFVLGCQEFLIQGKKAKGWGVLPGVPGVPVGRLGDFAWGSGGPCWKVGGTLPGVPGISRFGVDREGAVL